jgi:hypothetical protein
MKDSIQSEAVGRRQVLKGRFWHDCNRLTTAINVRVYDFKKASPKSNAPETRMDARAVFTTLLTCLRL